MSKDQAPLTDAELTAYLDGAADGALHNRIDQALAEDDALAARLEGLTIDMDGLNAAYDLDHLAPPDIPDDLTPASSGTVRLVWPAALAASFALGMLAMAALRPAPDWVETVASYQALYVTETLSGAAQSPEISQAVLQTAQDTLGVDLQNATKVDGLTFKRAQILAIDGRPLIQMAYLDPRGVPFAFCVTAAETGDSAPRQVMSHDLATSSWVSDGVGFVLLGGTDTRTVADLSVQLRQRL